MRQNFTMNDAGTNWLYCVGDSHIECNNVAYGLPLQLGRVLKHAYECSVRVKEFGASGDTSHATGALIGIRERSSKMWSPRRAKPAMLLLEGGVNNLSNGLTNADITKDFKSIIRAARNGVFPAGAATSRGNPSAVYQTGIVTSIANLPAGLPVGSLCLVTDDDGTSDGVNYNLTGTLIATTAPTVQGPPYKRKTMSAAPSVDQIWVYSGSGWYRTYNEEDFKGYGVAFEPYIRYIVVEGLHLYYGSEASGTPAASNTLVRTAQNNTTIDLLALGSCPYKNGTGQDLLFVDTFTPMANLITTAVPAASPADWSSIPASSDNHLGERGNMLVAGIISAKMNTTLTQTGQTWIQLMGGR